MSLCARLYTRVPCVTETMLQLCVGLLVLLGAVRGELLDPSVRTHPAIIFPVTTHGNSVTTVDNGTVHVWSEATNTVLDICNASPSCDGNLFVQEKCVAVTPDCNCLKWVGTLNTSRSSGVVSLSQLQSGCVRVYCRGNCTVSVDWVMASVGITVPATIYDMALNALARSPYAGAITPSIYFFYTFYEAVCNPVGFVPLCPSQTTMHIQQHKDAYMDNKGDMIGGIFIVVALACVVVTGVFLKHRQRQKE